MEEIAEIEEEELVDPNELVDSFSTDDPVRMYLKEIEMCIRDSLRLFRADVEHAGARIFAAHCAAVAHPVDIDAVSYTHLDVYKRQM